MQRSADSVIASFTDRTMAGEVLPAEEWMLGAQMLTVLMSEEVRKLYELQNIVAKLHVAELSKDNSSAARAKLMVAATDEYKEMKIQEAKLEQIKEFIRVAKKQAEIAMNADYHGK